MPDQISLKREKGKPEHIKKTTDRRLDDLELKVAELEIKLQDKSAKKDVNG